ncbi:MAG: Lrp/AsnC family transcriptional regulator [Candidatus Asgardarchaeia archaeon]
MPLSAFILVKTIPGKDRDIYNKLKEFDEVIEAVPVFGVYDIIIRVHVKEDSDLDTFVFNKLRRMDGITETMTLIIAHYDEE